MFPYATPRLRHVTLRLVGGALATLTALAACAAAPGPRASTPPPPATRKPSPPPATHEPATPKPTPAPDPAREARRALEREYRDLALKNRCPKGKDTLQGKWRFIGKSRTPDFRDELDVRGTHFVERLSGRPDGKPLKARLEGEIRCLFSNRVLVMVDKAQPEGAFGNHAGDAFPCDVLGAMDGSHDRFLLLCFFDFDVRPVAGREFEYGRR